MRCPSQDGGVLEQQYNDLDGQVTAPVKEGSKPNIVSRIFKRQLFILKII
jgi:hypothetical protein